MSVNEQLRHLAHQGYPSSGEGPGASWVDEQPFGPGGDTALREAVRPAAPRHRTRLTPRPTEEQAARAELRSSAAHAHTGQRSTAEPRPGSARTLRTGQSATSGGPQVSALPVLTPGQIAEDRAGTGHRARVPAALTEPISTTSRRGAAATTSPVERPETVEHEIAPATTAIPRGVYPATRVEPSKPPKSLLRSLVRGDVAPTAPMRVLDRLTATPFQNLRKFGDGTDRQARRTLNFALRLAETMFHYGADALDVENAIIAVCATYGVENLEVDITNQSVTINYVADSAPTGSLPAADEAPRTGRLPVDPDDPTAAFAGTPGTTGELRGPATERSGPEPRDDSSTSSHTVMRVVRSWTDNYAGLADSHQLVTRIIEGQMPLRSAERELSEINARPKPYPRWMVWMATVIAAGTLTLALGGSLVGALVAVGSATVVQLVTAKLGEWRIPEFFSLAANAFVVTLVAIVVSGLGVELSPPKVIAGGLIMLLPTTRMVSTMQDAINGFPVTAAGRLLSTAMAFLGIVAGIALGVTLTVNVLGLPPIDISQSSFTPTGVIRNIVFMLISVVLIAVTMQVKPRHIPPAVVAAFVGLIFYHTTSLSGSGSRIATGMGAVTSGCVASLLAARARIPQAVLAIPAMTFLLPGLTLFRGMYALTVETDAAGQGIAEMINAMASIILLAAGVVLAQYLMRPFIEQMQHLSQRRNRRR
ncbi:threonine/serine exporter family protein [Kocuria rhizophila]|uniref:threonine/serine ThrE exporter family protein n=1 Tax=Kocuria rhizophila TaxID=72000 RepID=UPI000EB39D25|nr:threonine/serine exporter family protein [Kocuria rhizophila]MDN3225916.1 threonine/serine exporter family protein [Kocuria rhizophila]WSQ05713.1 threonine/serine exporter family protein [Kocuria rhizophila]